MKKYAFLLLIFLSLPLMAQEIIAEYPVRWDRGIGEEFGRLIIKPDVVIFRSDDKFMKSLPVIYLESVKLLDNQWIQLKTTTESGLSFGLNDTYNFGVVGEKPDPAVIDRLNRLIQGARKLRIASAAKLPGEKQRYMVSKAETVGDDVGLLIITDKAVHYNSDTGNRDHTWEYSELNGVEISDDGHLILQTNERAIIKLGISTRNYSFVSMAEPFEAKDISYILEKIIAAKQNQQQ